jgi:hypothetical protein
VRRAAGWTHTLVGPALGALAEGLELVAETSADSSEIACGAGLRMYQRGAVLADRGAR